MKNKYLAVSYECLSSIGNSFELESMMGEVVMTFYQSTKADFVGYYENNESALPMVWAGTDKTCCVAELKNDCFITMCKEMYVMILPLKRGHMKFVYSQGDEIENIHKMLCNFKKKINFAISACEGVKEIEELNDELEDRVSQAVEKIREHEKMLMIQSKSAIMGEMLEMIAHQWRQPITSIGMMSNNMLFSIIVSEDEAIDKELFKGELEDINKQIKYLSHTIDDFRNFFKESKSKQQVFVDEIIDKSISLLKKQFEQHLISIEIKSRCEKCSLYTYKNELTQVILNLLNNSKDAFESKNIEDKRITIECEQEGMNVSISIQDNAGGIKEEILSKIFEPYFSTKKQKNGTGLGLYMSKIIINRHLGGEITAQNKQEGACFKINIPIKDKGE